MKTDADDLIENGFLGDACARWRGQNLVANSTTFSRLALLNRCLQGLIKAQFHTDIKITKLDNCLLSGLLNRFITNFQAAVLLLQYGLNQEVRILARSCLECCFVAGAARKMGPEFVKRLISAHNSSRKKFGASLKERAIKEQSLGAEELAEIDRLNLDYANRGMQSFDFAEMSHKGGLGDWYVFYRRLSNYAAHPTLDALTYRFDEAAEIFDIGPNDDVIDMAKVADDLCLFSCLFYMLFAEFVQVSADVLRTVETEFAGVDARQKAASSRA